MLVPTLSSDHSTDTQSITTRPHITADAIAGRRFPPPWSIEDTGAALRIAP